MTETVDPRINDEYTGVQMRLIKQKLDETRERALSRSTISDDEDLELSPRTRLQQSVLKRQELLERIKNEDTLASQLHKPNSGRMNRSHEYKAPPSRLSLPDRLERREEFRDSPRYRPRENYYYIYKNSNSQPPEYVYPKHVLEHQVKPMPTRLEPLQYSPRVQTIPQPAPQVVTVPQPYIINGGINDGQRPVANPTSTKQDMMEMMMLQNAQTHQMIMNQMMMSTLPVHNRPNPNPGLSVEDLISLKDQRKPVPEVHHHHYDPNPAGAFNNQRLPPIQTQVPAVNVMPTSRHYPREVAPLRQPMSKPKRKKEPKRTPRKWQAFQTKAPPPKKKFEYPDLPFPGPRPLRRFRHAGYAVFFTKLLQKAITSSNFKKPLPFSDDFLFGIKLKEAVAALHYQYLNPVGKIKRIFDQVIAFNSKDLTSILQPGAMTTERQDTVEDIGFILENIAFEITEIMPQTGVLGTHRKAVVYDMIKPGKLYPNGYFWNMEKKLIDFDQNDRTINVDNQRGFMLLAGCFLGRALVTTLLLKPIEYGLLSGRPSLLVEGNLRLLSTLFIYLLRKIYSVTGEPVERPHELGRFLYTDEEIEDLVKKLKKSFDYCVKLFMKWGKEYLNRLRKVQEIEHGRLYSA